MSLGHLVVSETTKFSSTNKVNLDTNHPETCSSLRRHSVSAPAQLCLDRVVAATRKLDHNIDSITALVRADRRAIESTKVTGTSLPSLVLCSSSATIQAEPHLENQDSIRLVTMSPPEGSPPRVEKTTIRTCHGCHAPIDSYHKGYPTGAKSCPLDHWDGCRGGIVSGRDPSGKEWRSCVPDFIEGDESTDGDAESDDERDDFHDTLNDDHLLDVASGGADLATNRQQQQVELLESPHQPSQEVVQGDSQYVSENSNDDKVVTMIDLGADLEEEQTLRDLEAANNLLKSQHAKQEDERVAQLKRERTRKIQMLKAENTRLSAGMGGDTGGGRPKHHHQGSSVQSGIPHPKANRANATSQAKSWQPAFQEHLTRNQSKAAQYRPEEASLYTGINMDGIRKIPEVGVHVDGLVGRFQSLAPSLDRRPSATLGQQLPAPTLKKKVVIKQNIVAVDDHEDDTIEKDFVFSRRPDGSLVKVRVVNESPRQSAKLSASARSAVSGSRRREALPQAPFQTDPESDLDASSDEDCDEKPQSGYRFRWKRDFMGEKYNVEEPAYNQSPEMVYKYVRDKVTGRSYKKLVPKGDTTPEQTYKWVLDPVSGQQVMVRDAVTIRPCIPVNAPSRPRGQYVDRRSVTSTPGLHMADSSRTPQLVTSRTAQSVTTQNERMPAFVVPAEDKQGKNNTPAIVQYARSCPVAWTSKVTSDKLNMGLWCWGYVAELLASRTGQTPSLQPGELEARMQHFLNVLEIALQPSNPAEFDGHSWRVARLYAEKVQHKIDRGETWLNFESRYGADSQPHELMAAKEEVRPVRKPKDPIKEDPKGKPKDDKKGTKRTCTTWNASSVEGKCDFEVQYDRACDRRHECSWCKEKGHRSLHHQRSFCRHRIAAGDQ